MYTHMYDVYIFVHTGGRKGSEITPKERSCLAPTNAKSHVAPSPLPTLKWSFKLQKKQLRKNNGKNISNNFQVYCHILQFL